MADTIITTLDGKLDIIVSSSTPAQSSSRGSIAIRDDAGNTGIYLNYDGATGWMLATPLVSATGALTWTLTDNLATALTIDTSGKTGLIVITTTNGSEAVTFASGVLTNLYLGVRAAADGQVDASFVIRKTYLGGASQTDFALPTRSGGWRIVDAYIKSGGATGGTVTIKTAAGAATVSDAMVPGNANAITRCTSLNNVTFASGATVRLDIAAGAPAGECWIRVEPL